MKLIEAASVLYERLKDLAYEDAEAVALRKVICAALGVRSWVDAVALILRHRGEP